jgi:Mrp family chromosome partitioning ATPase
VSAIDQAFIRAYEIDQQTPPTGAAAAARRSATTTTGPPPAASGPHFRVLHEAPAPPADRAPSGQRRPLSAFASPPHLAEARFRPALEVDAFRWPAVCDELAISHQSRWAAAVAALVAADDVGRSLIGVVGATPGAGTTTVVACLARLLVAAGKPVAIVDGNFENPRLAATLGLAVEAGWENVLAGRLQLAEAMIHSLHDRATLLPLAGGGAEAAAGLDALHASVTAGVLRYHYDMVLFDLGSLAGKFQGSVAQKIIQQCRLDGVALVTQSQHAPAVQPRLLMEAAPELAAICLGVIENESAAA